MLLWGYGRLGLVITATNKPIKGFISPNNVFMQFWWPNIVGPVHMAESLKTLNSNTVTQIEGQYQCPTQVKAGNSAV